MKRTAVAMALGVMTSSYALGEENPQAGNHNLIALHQRCVLHAFVKNIKILRSFDPDLLDKSISQCESLLGPLKSAIISRTNDAGFAESQLDKIRQASKRGVAIALVGYIAGRDKQ